MRFLLQNSRFLAFGLALAFLSSFGQTYFIGVYRPVIAQEYELTNSEFGLYYLLITICSAIGLNRLGHIIDKTPLVPYTGVLLILMAAACALVGLAPGFSLILVGLIAARLMGQGMLTHAAMTSMSRYYDRNRGLAVAIAGLGFPIGQAVLPPLALKVTNLFSWQESWLFFSGSVLVLALPFVLFLLRGHGARHAEWLAKQAEAAGRSASADETNDKRRRDVLRDKRFYLMVPALLMGPFWITAVFFFASEVAAMKAVSLEELTGYYGFYALGSVAAPFLGGLLVDKVGGRHLIPAYPPLFALALLIVLADVGPFSIAAFLALLGLGAGIALPINNAVWAELYGTRYLGEIKSLATSIVVVSTALSPYLLGVALDNGVRLQDILATGSVICLIATLLVMPVAKSA